MNHLPLDGLFELTPAVTRQLTGVTGAQLPVPGTSPAPEGLIRIDLPRWDIAWEARKGRGGWPKIDPETGKVIRHRRVWDALRGNARNAHYAQRHKATQEVIAAVVSAAQLAGLRPCRYLDVTLVWSTGDHRRADEDNLWPLLKACCDALARGRKDLPGLHLVADDDSRHMRKTPRIDRPPTLPGLWLEIISN